MMTIVIGLLSCSATANPIFLRGANGSEIEVFGVLEGNLKGLVLKVQEEDDLITVPWSKLDLEFLEEAHPDIHDAYRECQFGEPVFLKMGGFADYVNFEEAITRLYQGLERSRFYTIPENIDYIFEDDPDIIRMKERDIARYSREIRSMRRDMQEFLREIYPKESIIIDDSGVVHRKERDGIPEPQKGETSLRVIIEYIADTRSSVSRMGINYLREVTLFREDFRSTVGEVRNSIPNATFHYGNADHMKLPGLIDESRESIDHFMESKSFHRGQQYKLGEFYNFVYALADEYGVSYRDKSFTENTDEKFPRLDFSGSF
ncbi:hypothetical protein [Rubellicoccus peritrichatus]|uniref:Uncharacterized protein n=1 Tax=Rubellicoccus peritrichatus TaxID=3080537 RepID=A0AAQ3QUZ7_9BACT|nr:hypothetical protein [Puniceicoccus sp. CR14]WOO40352.1 hypothetical protein RZN69_17170 [Puniceicoccus sp. CR14]